MLIKEKNGDVFIRKIAEKEQEQESEGDRFLLLFYFIKKKELLATHCQ